MWAEWRFIRQNRLLRVVFVALLCIPTIYAVIFLGSLWDAYNKTEQLPVAVVNQDQPVDYQGQTLHIGDDLVTQLRTSKQLDFQFVEASQAQRGLQAGDYYMVITVPKDFSHNATTLLDEHPQRMQLAYQTSAGHSYIAAKMAKTAIATLNQKISDEVSELYAQTLFDALNQLATGYQKASDTNEKIADGTLTIEQNSQRLTAYLQQLASSTLTLSDGTQTLTRSLSDYTQGVAQLADGSQQVTNGLTHISDQQAPLQTGLTQLASGSQQLQTGVAHYTNNVAQLATGAEQLNDGVQQMTQAFAGETQQQIIQSLQDSLATYQQGLADLDAVLATEPNAHLQPLVEQVAQLSQNMQTLTDAVANNGLNEQQQAALLAPVESMQQTLDNLTQSLADTISTQESQQAQLQTDIAQLQNTLGSKQDSASLAGETSVLLQKIAQAQQDMQRLATGSQQVRDGLVELTANNASLSQGAQQVHDGIAQLQQQVSPLMDGLTQLATGSQQVSAGAQQLTAQNTPLLAGAAQLNAGSEQLQTGSQQLADSAKHLPNALQQVVDGNSQLAQQLQATSQQAEVTATSDTNQQLAAPTTLKHRELDQVANNGTGMAPYMMAVGLYVAFVAFNIMVDMVQPRAVFKRAVTWWLSKFNLLLGFAVVAATLMYGATLILLGLQPVAPWATYGVLVLTALVFGTLITLLNVWLGKPGAFVALVLLVLQLSTSAGTYPIQLSGAFYQWLHPWLPMTYVVDALRHTMMMHSSPWASVQVLLGILFVALVVWSSYYWQHAHQLKKHQATA